MTAKMLNRYLDGDLPPAGRREVEDHLDACEACRRMLSEIKAMDQLVRQSAEVSTAVPDVAGRVTAELQRRGAFFRARVTHGRRALFGESLLSSHMAAAVLAAAAVLVVALVGTDYMTRSAWSRRAAPVVADAERVLVRLVMVDPTEQQDRLAWARQEARKLELSDRLAAARTGASTGVAGDLAYLHSTFALLARDEPLPAELQAELAAGDVLQRAIRLRDDLKPKS
jgi:hypothetical protein